MDVENENKFLWGFCNKEIDYDQHDQHKPVKENHTTKICIITAVILLLGLSAIYTTHSLKNTGEIKVLTGTMNTSINNLQHPPALGLIIPLIICVIYIAVSGKIHE